LLTERLPLTVSKSNSASDSAAALSEASATIIAGR
jgi:hypothetical protein